MIFAIYLLITGIFFPVLLGYILYQKFKERSKPNEEIQRPLEEDVNEG